jgi:hypothetical protein
MSTAAAVIMERRSKIPVMSMGRAALVISKLELLSNTNPLSLGQSRLLQHLGFAKLVSKLLRRKDVGGLRGTLARLIAVPTDQDVSVQVW